jgi:hypothetical protein
MPQTQLDSDSFNGTNGNSLSTYNANWVQQSTTTYLEATIEGTPGVGTPTGGGLEGANYRTGFTWTNDQWAELKADSSQPDATALRFKVGVRMQTDNTVSGYYASWDLFVNSGKYTIDRCDNNVSTVLATTTTALAANDVVNLQIVGTVLTLQVNGSTIGTYDTASDGTKYSTGNPGLWLGNNTNSTKMASGSPAWRAGSVTSGGPLVGSLAMTGTQSVVGRGILTRSMIQGT